MKNIGISFSLVVLFSLCSFNAWAGILESGEEKIFFSPSRIQKNVTWYERFSLTENGLETKQLPENQRQDVWVQTHAFPIGLSWRPPSGANFRIFLDGSINEIDSSLPIPAQIFLRYSCDKANWSTWYNFSETDKKTPDGLKIYESKIFPPYSANERYRNLMQEWWKTDPIWSSDETEFCEWLVKKEPDFFAKQMPFIGYIQVRVEKISVNSTQNLKSMTIGYSWAVGGLQSIPKDKSKVRKNTDDKWFFERTPN